MCFLSHKPLSPRILKYNDHIQTLQQSGKQGSLKYISILCMKVQITVLQNHHWNKSRIKYLRGFKGRCVLRNHLLSYRDVSFFQMSFGREIRQKTRYQSSQKNFSKLKYHKRSRSSRFTFIEITICSAPKFTHAKLKFKSSSVDSRTLLRQLLACLDMVLDTADLFRWLDQIRDFYE